MIHASNYSGPHYVIRDISLGSAGPISSRKPYVTSRQDHGLNPLDAIWDTEKLRAAMKDDKATLWVFVRQDFGV